MKRLLIWLLTILLLIGGMVRVLSHPMNMPFIYYVAYNGIVIERADGLYRRVLGESVVTKDFVLDVTWSPSGRWMGLVQYDSDVPGLVDLRTADIWAIRYDDRQQVSISSIVPTWGNYYMWSPTQDLMLVAPNDWLFDPCRGCPIYIVDIASEQVMLTVETENVPARPYGSGLSWSPDGQYIYYVAPIDTGSGATEQSTGEDMVVVFTNMQGVAQIRPIANNSSISWTHDNRMVYWHPAAERLVIEDLKDETQQIIDLPLTLPAYHLEWNPEHTQALLMPNRGVADGETRLWLVTVDDGTVVEISADTNAPYYHFLSWSSDGKKGLLIGSDIYLYVLDMEQRTLNQAPLPVFSGIDYSWGEGYPPRVPSVQWMPDGRAYLDWAYHSWEYDSNLDVFSATPLEWGPSARISSDERYVLFTWTCTAENEDWDRRRGVYPFSLCLIDLEADSIREIVSHYASSSYSSWEGRSFHNNIVDWHTDFPWVIVGQWIPGRYSPSYYYEIVEGPNLLQFAPEGARTSYSNVRWLPDHVPVARR